MSTRSKVFVSYSHKDVDWLKRLQVHLRPLTRAGEVDLWDDTQIRAGTKWREEIEKALAAAKVAVLLVSADFLASDFVHHNELPPLLQAAEQDGATILWVLVGPCLWKRSPLGVIQAAHRTDEPLNSLPKEQAEAALFRLAEQIAEAVQPNPR